PLGNGQVSTSLNIQHLETTVSALDGETVVLGGLINSTDNKTENKVPWIGDLPGIGALFRYRTEVKKKTELLIIMTPHIVRNRCRRSRRQPYRNNPAHLNQSCTSGRRDFVWSRARSKRWMCNRLLRARLQNDSGFSRKGARMAFSFVKDMVDSAHTFGVAAQR